MFERCVAAGTTDARKWLPGGEVRSAQRPERSTSEEIPKPNWEAAPRRPYPNRLRHVYLDASIVALKKAQMFGRMDAEQQQQQQQQATNEEENCSLDEITNIVRGEHTQQGY